MTNLQLMSIQWACSMSQVSRGCDGDTEASHFSYLSATRANRFGQVLLLLYRFKMPKTFSHSRTAWWKFMGPLAANREFHPEMFISVGRGAATRFTRCDSNDHNEFKELLWNLILDEPQKQPGEPRAHRPEGPEVHSHISIYKECVWVWSVSCEE